MKFIGRTAVTAVAAASLVVLTPTASHASSRVFINWGSRKCLEIENSSTANGARAQQWDCKGQDGAEWYWEWVGPGQQFRIINAHSGKCLEVADSRTDNGARVQQWDCVDGVRAQLWIKSYGSESQYIGNYGTGKYLEVENSSTDNGARVQQWDRADTPGQRWW